MPALKENEAEHTAVEDLTALYLKILQTLSEDPTREGLVKTPARAAKAMLEVTAGYHMDLNVVANGAIYESQCNNIVVVEGLEFYSLCEHHCLPFYGQCNISYLPNGRVLGLSKFARILDMFSKRLQIQENLTVQVAEAIDSLIQPKGVLVEISAEHFCMKMRGISKQHSNMRTRHQIGTLS